MPNARGRLSQPVDDNGECNDGNARHQRAAGVEALVDLRLGDMRALGTGSLALDAPASLIVCPFRSLLHLRGWEEKAELFRAVAASLAPGGRFEHAVRISRSLIERHPSQAPIEGAGVEVERA